MISSLSSFGADACATSPMQHPPFFAFSCLPMKSGFASKALPLLPLISSYLAPAIARYDSTVILHTNEVISL